MKFAKISQGLRILLWLLVGFFTTYYTIAVVRIGFNGFTLHHGKFFSLYKNAFYSLPVYCMIIVAAVSRLTVWTTNFVKTKVFPIYKTNHIITWLYVIALLLLIVSFFVWGFTPFYNAKYGMYAGFIIGAFAFFINTAKFFAIKWKKDKKIVVPVLVVTCILLVIGAVWGAIYTVQSLKIVEVGNQFLCSVGNGFVWYFVITILLTIVSTICLLSRVPKE